ncbi:helix-turn-helix domain-containing protein [Sneathiella sp. HT1-7]|uniref:helix-turn-helix domain-containing protein n=1 Tax=Sneathiella sp. HT1-7 TaxID=2887192 RepID=UPI001D14E454|nr:helix-turn-helix transcriptional regulator [Sneathiella sp. HT1-7]MCC3303593.1 helix-turn-helix domain-containing protein [Sneathiella sp. HT1-7]
MKSLHLDKENPDKRDVAEIFRDRMALLLARKGFNLSQFANSVGIDRSALSQFLAPGSTRLPRAETLCAISRTYGVSVDWLMGLIANDESASEAVPMIEIERVTEASASVKLAKWHREAMGYKIRYVPSTLPDLLRTEEIGAYEFGDFTTVEREAKERQMQDQLSYSRRPETDMEVCMPLQAIEQLAQGEGIWRQVPISIRRDQMKNMIRLTEELYPTFRLFLFDARKIYSAAYTLFGPLRAAIYIGNMYLLVNSVEHIRALTVHFDGLIRSAEVAPDKAPETITEYLKALS